MHTSCWNSSNLQGLNIQSYNSQDICGAIKISASCIDLAKKPRGSARLFLVFPVMTIQIIVYSKKCSSKFIGFLSQIKYILSLLSYLWLTIVRWNNRQQTSKNRITLHHFFWVNSTWASINSTKLFEDGQSLKNDSRHGQEDIGPRNNFLSPRGFQAYVQEHILLALGIRKCWALKWCI